jgi:hypothetical protein
LGLYGNLGTHIFGFLCLWDYPLVLQYLIRPELFPLISWISEAVAFTSERYMQTGECILTRWTILQSIWSLKYSLKTASDLLPYFPVPQKVPAMNFLSISLFCPSMVYLVKHCHYYMIHVTFQSFKLCYVTSNY